MDLITRAEWGAQYPPAFTTIPGPVLGVTCHWEGPPMGFPWPHSRCARKIRAIERFHKVFRDWAGIAYNLLVCPHGYVYEGRGAGVRSAANGTSSIGGNDQWYAVCATWGQGDPFTIAAQDGFVDAINYLREHGAGQAVNGHRDHHPTECPGDEVYAWAHGTHTLEEDDMPLSNDDADKIINRLMDRNLTAEDGELTVAKALRQGAQADNTQRLLTDLPGAIADEFQATIPAGQPFTRVQLERASAAAVRKVLGGLDEQQGASS